MEERLAQAVRNSLNLPRLRVMVRRGKIRGNWSVSLQYGSSHSEWITLDASSVAVVREIGLLPPMHLGAFRLAYEAARSEKSELIRQKM